MSSELTFETVIAHIQQVSKAYIDFKKLTLEKRAQLLENFIFSVVQKKDEMIEKIQKAQNTTADIALLEYVEALDYLHFFKVRFVGVLEKRASIGPFVIFGSWSSPFLRTCEKVVTALSFGNTVLLHCSPEQFSFYNDMRELLIAAHFPEDSLHVMATDDKDLVDLIYTHPSVRGVNFSGHFYEGEFLRPITPDPRKKYKINFGGKNPLLFLYDADLSDLEEYVQTALQFSYMGEVRYNRWFIQEKIYADFQERVRAIIEKLDPSQWGIPNQGYLQQLTKQQSQLQQEKNWASRPQEIFSQNRLSPLLSYDFSNCSSWHQQETLGPVLTLTRFKNSAEAVKFANTTYYATSAAVFSVEYEKAKDVGSQLQMPLTTYNRLPQRYWEKPMHAAFESGLGNDVVDFDFFSVPKVLTVY